MAYTYQDRDVGPMCLGEAGTLYTAGGHSGVVSVLDCSTTSFTYKHKFPTIKYFWTREICYMNHSGVIALLSVMDRRICATSSDGHIVWNKNYR